jgi:quinol monooxygenase YgiN
MDTPEMNRNDFLKTTAAAGAAAVLAGAGFNRAVDAAAAEVGEGSITQLAVFKYKADKKDMAAEALAGLAKKVEENEPGVLAYIPHLNEADNEVTFFEVYKDADAMKNHGTMPYMADLRPMFGPDGAFMPPLKIVKLTRVGGFHR